MYHVTFLFLHHCHQCGLNKVDKHLNLLVVENMLIIYAKHICLSVRRPLNSCAPMNATVIDCNDDCD